MSKETMPAADAAHYELAFHVLPTVAEGEVADVFASLKSAIETAGGTLTTEEEPKRFDLAYEIIKYLEGRNRKFTSAYFGWIRFTLEPAQLAELTETVEGENRLLRHLLIRLTKMEEANSFMFHEALEDDQVAEEVDEEVKEDEKKEEAPAEEAKDGKEAAEEVK
jgi:ribosomal protein S6